MVADFTGEFPGDYMIGSVSEVSNSGRECVGAILRRNYMINKEVGSQIECDRKGY